MALGEFKLFQFKSKKQREKEEREYAAWAFPYGEMQREKLTELYLALNPKESAQLGLASFLTCKELYESTLEDSETPEEAANKMINIIGSYGNLIRSQEMPMLLALVLTDAEIDEKCEYPSANEVRARIQEVTNLRIVKKRSFFKSKRQ